jgi:hypothetical protein
MRKLKTPEEIISKYESDERGADNSAFWRDGIAKMIIDAQRDALECAGGKIYQDVIRELKHENTFDNKDIQEHNEYIEHVAEKAKSSILNLIPKEK